MKIALSALPFMLFFLIVNSSYAQSGWNTGNYYAYQGNSTTETYFQNEFDYYCNCTVTVRYCRQLTWYQEYRSGYVNLWGPNGWYSEYQEGYAWYCTWSQWYRC